MHCPLCHHSPLELVVKETKGALVDREFWRCGECHLISVPPAFQIDDAEEKALYDLHENDSDDPSYRGFLNRIAQPLLKLLPKSALGLDFGSGPGPTLSNMLETAGHRCALYDKYYAADESVWDRQYDFITATEVFEHLREPAAVLESLLTHLQPHGYLALMTQRWISEDRFKNWQYRNDPTHIIFMHEQTCHWLAATYGMSIAYLAHGVVIFRKTGEPARKPVLSNDSH